MNPINPNQAFSHDVVKYVYQEPDVRRFNPTVTIKPFKIDPSEKSKKDINKEKKEGKKKNSKSGFFGLF